MQNVKKKKSASYDRVHFNVTLGEDECENSHTDAYSLYMQLLLKLTKKDIERQNVN